MDENEGFGAGACANAGTGSLRMASGRDLGLAGLGAWSVPDGYEMGNEMTVRRPPAASAPVVRVITPEGERTITMRLASGDPERGGLCEWRLSEPIVGPCTVMVDTAGLAAGEAHYVDDATVTPL